jgi:hypothetical protein
MIFSVILACCAEIFVFSFLFQCTLADAKILDKNISLPLLDTSAAQTPKAFLEPDSDRIAKYVGRIADLEGRLNSLKKQTTIAMGRAEKSTALSQKVSLLED